MNVKLKLSIFLTMALIVSYVFNYETTAKYTQVFEPAIQNVSTSSWEVDSSIEHNGQYVNGQVLDNFKPGEVRTNLIKFQNNNDYNTIFFLEVITEGLSDSNNLFLNSNVELVLMEEDQDGNYDESINKWISKDINSNSISYFYNVTLQPKSSSEMRIDIKWISGEGDSSFADTGGKISYKVRAEQEIIKN